MISKQPLIRVAKSPLTYGIHCVFIFKKRLASVSFINTGARNKKLFYRMLGDLTLQAKEAELEL